MTLPPVRHLFDLPEDVTYLNCAYQGPLPLAALEVAQAGLTRKTRPWTITADDFFAPVEPFRAAVAELIGVPGDSDGVALTPSVSYGVAIAAANLRLDPQQCVVVLADQFPSNVYAWRAVAERDGGIVHTVARPADGDWTSALLADLDDLGERVGIVAVPPCHWTDGGRIDLVAVGDVARRAGAALVVDATQALGALPFSAAEVQPDFVACSSYKWLLGPYSVGFLWVAPPHRDGTPIEHNWIQRAGSNDFSSLADYTDEFREGARRYDVGEVSSYSLVPAAHTALRLLSSWGVEAVADHAGVITGRVAEGDRRWGSAWRRPAYRSPHLIGLRLNGRLDPRVLATTLADEAVHVSVRGDSVRVSAHAFNTVDDADRLLAVLATVLA